jgi:short/branched chain acyl-CoA dehydrogenase
VIHDVDVTPKGRELQQTAREFAREVIAPQAQGFWDSAEFPQHIMDQMAEMGFMGLLAPEEYGGSGISTVDYVAVLEEIAWADMTVALTWQVHILITGNYLKFGTEEQRQYWVPKMTSGEILVALGGTEPDAGSDLKSIKTTAVREDGHWVINGRKMFITNAGTPRSDGLVLLARTGTRKNGDPDLSTIIVPKDAPGFRVGEKIRTLGWRAMDNRYLYFEDCRVPEENLLGVEGKGLSNIMTGLDLGRIAFGACSTGLAQACLDHSLEYARERVQFGQPISKYQAVQMKLADMATKIDAARALTLNAARARDAGSPEMSMAAAKAKLFASRTCVECSDEAFQIHGGRGFLLDGYPIARLYADAKTMEVGEGTNEMQRMAIAKHLGC